jgi:hypothetical protein
MEQLARLMALAAADAFRTVKWDYQAEAGANSTVFRAAEMMELAKLDQYVASFWGWWGFYWDDDGVPQRAEPFAFALGLCAWVDGVRRRVQ